MLTSEQLDRAVSQGVVSREQVEALLKLAANEQSQADASTELDFSVLPQDEPFRLLKGFRDFFIAIGVVILAVGLSMMARIPIDLVLTNGHEVFGLLPSLYATLTMMVLVAIAIVISEWVTKSQRLPLSSLVLTLVFAFWIFLLCGSVTLSIAIGVGADQQNMRGVESIAGIIGLFGAVLGLIWYYRRYRLPFVLLPLAGTAVMCVVMLVNNVFELDFNTLSDRILIGLCGVGVFVLAMKYDLKDRFRTTRLSECAFWLHLLAAPLIVHSILTTGDGFLKSVTILLIVVLLAIFALIIDRRAILVSALVYLGYSLFSLVKELSFLGEFDNSIALMVLGAMVLGLGLGWSSVRRFLVLNLLSKSVRDLVPPVIS